jgi:hypothetical protein
MTGDDMTSLAFMVFASFHLDHKLLSEGAVSPKRIVASEASHIGSKRPLLLPDTYKTRSAVPRMTVSGLS